MERRVFVFWSLFIAAAIFRVWSTFNVRPPDIGACSNEKVRGDGYVVSEPERKETGQVFVISEKEMSTGGEPCPPGLLIRVKTKLYPRFSLNDKVTFEGKLSEPFNFGEEADGRIFDYIGYLAKDDIYFEIKSAAVHPDNSYSGYYYGDYSSPASSFIFSDSLKKFHSSLYSFKRRFVSNLEYVLGEPHAALAAGLVVGEKSALGKDLIDDFRLVGLIHIVVLSGYNITIVGDAMRKLFSFLPRVYGIVVGGTGIVLFGILVGGGATVVRSCFMASIALFADLIRRDYSVIRALILAGFIMVILNPMILLHDPSFQLSFLATLGLVLLARPIEERLTFMTDKFGLRSIVSSTVATQIFISPFILYMMGQISIIGMLANVLVLPLIPVTMLVVFMAGISGMFSLYVSQAFGWLAHFLLSYELFIVRSFADLPFASVSVPAFSFWWVVAFYAAFAVIFFVIEYRDMLNRFIFRIRIRNI